MTSQQKNFILPLVMAMSQIKDMKQLDVVWAALEAACRVAGINIGSKPTSIPQAKSVADSIRKRLLS